MIPLLNARHVHATREDMKTSSGIFQKKGHKMIEDKKTPDEDMSLKRLREITTYTSNMTSCTIEEWNESKIGYDLRYQFQL